MPSNSALKQHLLVLDDEAAVGVMLKNYLERHGYLVSTAKNAKQAVAILNETAVHLILLDVILDGADGMILLKEFKAEHPNLPIIMLTGLGYDEHLFREASGHGASGYLSKNLPLNQVLLEIHRVLNY